MNTKSKRQIFARDFCSFRLIIDFLKFVFSLELAKLSKNQTENSLVYLKGNDSNFFVQKSKLRLGHGLRVILTWL